MRPPRSRASSTLSSKVPATARLPSKRGGKPHALLVGKANDFDRERQPHAPPVQVGDAGNRRDHPERPVPFAGVAHGVVMRAQHQARQPRPLALVAAADIADGVEMRGHAGVSHPRHQEIGRGAMFGRKEYPRQIIRRLGNRPELVDPAYDFVAEHWLIQYRKRCRRDAPRLACQCCAICSRVGTQTRSCFPM